MPVSPLVAPDGRALGAPASDGGVQLHEAIVSGVLAALDGDAEEGNARAVAGGLDGARITRSSRSCSGSPRC